MNWVEFKDRVEFLVKYDKLHPIVFTYGKPCLKKEILTKLAPYTRSVPEEYIEFLACAGGWTLWVENEHGTRGRVGYLEVYDPEQVIRSTNNFAVLQDIPDGCKPVVVFSAGVNSDMSFFVEKNNGFSVGAGYHENAEFWVTEPEIVADSFAEWLEKIVSSLEQGNVPAFWLKEE